MTARTWPRPGVGTGFAAQLPAVLPAIAAALLLAAGLAAATYRYPLPSAELLALGGLALIGLLALAVARYDAAVALGLVLLAVVRVEPAPPDVVFAVVMVVALVTGRFDLSRMPFVILISLGLLITLNFLSIIEAVDPGRAALFVSITLYLAVFSLWLTGFINSTKRARLIVVAYLVAAMGSAVIGSLALFVPFPGNELFVLRGSRAAALFADPNVFGPFLIPAALLVLQELMQPRLLRIGAALKILMLVVLTLGVLFSFSRAAWLNFGVAMLVLTAVLAFRGQGTGKIAVAIGTLVLTGGVAAAVISATGSSTFLEQRAQTQTYDSERFNAQRVGVQLAQTHPVGIGPGQFLPIVKKAAHNTYLRVFTEQGAGGLLIFVVLIGATLVFAVRNAVLGHSTYGIGSAALLAAWCGILVNGAFVDTLHWRHLWLIAALIWAGTMLSRDRERRRAPTPASPLS